MADDTLDPENIGNAADEDVLGQDDELDELDEDEDDEDLEDEAVDEQ